MTSCRQLRVWAYVSLTSAGRAAVDARNTHGPGSVEHTAASLVSAARLAKFRRLADTFDERGGNWNEWGETA